MEGHETLDALLACSIAAIGFLGATLELYRQNKEKQLEQQKKRINLTRMDELLWNEYIRCRDFDIPEKQDDLMRGLKLVDNLLWEKDIPEKEYQRVKIIMARYGLNNRESHYLWRGCQDG